MLPEKSKVFCWAFKRDNGMKNKEFKTVNFLDIDDQFGSHNP